MIHCLKDCCENRQRCFEHNAGTMTASSMRGKKKKKEDKKKIKSNKKSWKWNVGNANDKVT